MACPYDIGEFGLVEKIKNNTKLRNFAFNQCYIVVFQPIDYARTLIQLGYEPFPPVEANFLGFGSKYLALPNVFDYIKYIKSVDGFFGCFRGLTARLCQNAVSSFTYNQLLALSPFPNETSPPPQGAQKKKSSRLFSKELIEQNCIDARSCSWIRSSTDLEVKQVVQKFTWDLICTSVATIASHPFYVIAVRNMGQFVGRETIYNSLRESIGEIFREEGIVGFFAGLVPRLMADISSIFLTAATYFGLHYFLGGKQQTMEGVSLMASNIIATSYTYQFHVLSATMAVNGCGLAIGRYPYTQPLPFESWLECFSHLRDMGQLKRGSSLFGRYYGGPVVEINKDRKPSGFHFGPRHPPGLGWRDPLMIPGSKMSTY